MSSSGPGAKHRFRCIQAWQKRTEMRWTQKFPANQRKRGNDSDLSSDSNDATSSFLYLSRFFALDDTEKTHGREVEWSWRVRTQQNTSQILLAALITYLSRHCRRLTGCKNAKKGLVIHMMRTRVLIFCGRSPAEQTWMEKWYHNAIVDKIILLHLFASI